MESQAILMNILYSVALTSISVSCTVFYHPLENTDFAELQRSFKYWDISLQNIFKIRFVTLTVDLIRKIFKYWEAVKLTLVETGFPK